MFISRRSHLLINDSQVDADRTQGSILTIELKADAENMDDYESINKYS
jgi:hypothetical protein